MPRGRAPKEHAEEEVPGALEREFALHEEMGTHLSSEQCSSNVYLLG